VAAHVVVSWAAHNSPARDIDLLENRMTELYSRPTKATNTTDPDSQASGGGIP
jgi:hypothetical protein